MVTSLLHTEISCLLFEWFLVILTKPQNSYLCDLSFPKMIQETSLAHQASEGQNSPASLSGKSTSPSLLDSTSFPQCSEMLQYSTVGLKCTPLNILGIFNLSL